MSGVRTHAPEIRRNTPKSGACDDMIDGQRAMHKAGERYLEADRRNGRDAYKARLCGRTSITQPGARLRVLWAWLSVKADHRGPCRDCALSGQHIDLAGTTLYTFAKRLCEEVLEYGRMGPLRDHPPMPENVAGDHAGDG